jgi:hypothetical protein
VIARRTALLPSLLVLVLASFPTLLAQETEPAAGGGIAVAERGLGTGIENRALVGQASSFVEGQKVYFWTRVVDGQAGDRIRHVWIREGTEVLSIGLSIGGPHWRTYSNKTLHAGSAGSWKVEVRDSAGNLLASESFTCTAE